MRSLLGTFGSILCCSVVALSQGASQTVQVGYALVTPSTPITSGMVVFQNIAQTRGQETFQVGVIPSNLVTNALLPVDVSSSSSKNLGVAIVNPNNGIANVTMTIFGADGTGLTATTVPISAHRQISMFVTELFPPPAPGTFSTQAPIPKEFSGTLIASSALPVSILGLAFSGQNFSAIPLTDLAPRINPVPLISNGVGGLGAVLLPQFVTGAGWATTIIIVNTTTTSLTVRVDVFTAAGIPLTVTLNGVTSSSFTNLVVPAGGRLTIGP